MSKSMVVTARLERRSTWCYPPAARVRALKVQAAAEALVEAVEARSSLVAAEKALPRPEPGGLQAAWPEQGALQAAWPEPQAPEKSLERLALMQPVAARVRLAQPESRVLPRSPATAGSVARRPSLASSVHENDGAFQWQQPRVPTIRQLGFREKEQATRVFGGQVDATVALRNAEAVVPIGA